MSEPVKHQASVNSPRIDQIARCTDEHAAMRQASRESWARCRPLELLLWEMDWLAELHRLVYDWNSN